MDEITDEERVERILQGILRIRNLDKAQAEQLAWQLLYKWKEEGLNYLENITYDAKMIIGRLFSK